MANFRVILVPVTTPDSLKSSFQLRRETVTFCFESGLQRYAQTPFCNISFYASKLICQWNREENIFSVSNFLLTLVCDGVSMTLHQVLWQMQYNDITGTLWLQRSCSVTFLLHKERILPSSICSSCLEITNVILSYWDVLCGGLPLNEKERENKAGIRPSVFLLMYKSPWIWFKNVSGAPQYVLYSIFKFTFCTALGELCQLWFDGKI